MPDLRPNPTLCLEYRAEQPIHHAFIQQASRCPAAIAIIGQHTTCNYSQLEQISAGIAALGHELHVRIDFHQAPPCHARGFRPMPTRKVSEDRSREALGFLGLTTVKASLNNCTTVL